MANVALEQTPPALWRNISFHLLWTSTFASGFGDRMAMFAAMAMLGYSQQGTDDSSLQAAINFFFFLPYLIWSPLAGWLTDRLPRKYVLLAADQLRGLILLAGLLLVPATGVMVPDEHQPLVWTMMLGLGVMAATFVPARLSVVPSVVGMSMITRANGAVVSMGVIGNLAGMLIGGKLVEHAVEPAIYVGAACYIISGMFWVFLRMPWEKPRAAQALHGPLHALREVAEGIRYAWRKRVVWILIVMSALVWGGTAVYVPAMGTLNVQLYDGDIASFAYVMAMVGLGMLTGAVGLALCNPLRGLEVVMAAGFFGLGICLGLQAIIPVYAVGLLLGFGVGLSGALLMVPINTLVQRVSANHVRGRVFGAKEVVGELGMVVISFAVWRIPGTDPAMKPLMIALALAYLAAGAYGLWRYVLHGPIHTGLLNGIWRVIRFASEAVHGMETRGRGNVPRVGPGLLVANHTAGVDPMLIQSAIPRRIRWLMATEYMLPGLGCIWRRIEPIPVARLGRDASAARQAINALRDGHLVAVFPEGGINRGDQLLGDFSAGVGLIAGRADAPVIPVWIDGTPRGHVLSSFFRFSRARVRFGQPFTVEGLKADQATQEIRRRLEALAHDTPPDAATDADASERPA